MAPAAYPLGGLATWLDDLTPGLRERGFDVTVGLVEGDHHDVDAYLELHPLPRTIRIRSRTGTREGRIRALVRAFEETAPDLVAAVNIVDVYPAVQRLRAAGRDLKVAMTLHGLQADLFADLREFGALVDSVIVTNRLTGELCRQLASFPEDRIYYAPYGVPSSAAPSVRCEAGKLRVGFVGRFERDQKRIQDLPEIVETTLRDDPGVRFLFAGGGPDEAWLRSALESHAATSGVRFCGALPVDEVRNGFLPGTEILLVTSSWETGPIVAWEAMSRGVVLVSSRYVGSGRENSLRDGENCLLFEVGDVAGASRAILRLRDPELRERLGREGRALVAQRYSTESSLAAWAESFQTTLQLPVRPLAELRSTRHRAGRLDRLLGERLGESIRQVVGSGFDHDDPGGEWPHTANPRALSDVEFFRQIAREDRPC
ncbi:MAG: glycosyltransferase family 4 protein [Thermoanaerobaculia bacterium]